MKSTTNLPMVQSWVQCGSLRAVAALTALLGVIAPGVAAAQSHGVPVDGYPNWHERMSLVFINMARMDPRYYAVHIIGDPSILTSAQYPAVDPLYWHLALNQVARSHSDDLGNTSGCTWGHDSCDGTPMSERIGAVYSYQPYENLNAGVSLNDPLLSVNAALCEASAPPCHADGYIDGHRANVMRSSVVEAGVGYAVGTNQWVNYYTQDFGVGPPGGITPPSPIVTAGHLRDGSQNRFLLNFLDPVYGDPQYVYLIQTDNDYNTYQMSELCQNTWSVDLLAWGVCFSYRFVVTDGNGQNWIYPEAGQFRNFGDGCTEDYVEHSYEWQTGPWGDCSEYCDGGIQTRSVSCVNTVGGGTVPDGNCFFAHEPADEQACNIGACTYSWAFDPWGECSAPCDGGIQTRDVYCVLDQSGETVDDSLCDPGATPPDEQECNTQECPLFADGFESGDTVAW